MKGTVCMTAKRVNFVINYFPPMVYLHKSLGCVVYLHKSLGHVVICA